MSFLLSLLATTQILSGAARDSIPVDTSMQLGRMNWAPYDTPLACLHAAMVIDSLRYRTVTELRPYIPEQDTMSSAAVAAANACGAKFQSGNLPPSELLDMVHLSLIRGDDSLANTVANQYVSAFAPARQSRALLELDSTFFRAKPMRLAAADGIVARLDAMGPSAAAERMIAHRRHFLEADKRYDVARLEREAQAMIKTAVATRSDLDGGAIFALLFSALYESRDVNVATANTVQLLHSIQADTAVPVAKAIGALWSGIIGHPAPPLHVDHWAGGSNTSQVWPTPGKVSLLLMGQGLMLQPEFAPVLRRIIAHYGSTIDVILLCKTAGFFNDSPPLTPTAEAERLARYFVDELHLPVRVALQESTFDTLPDGRRYQGAAPFESDPVYHIDGILVDPSGKVALAGFSTAPQQSAMLEAWVGRVSETSTSNTK